MINTTREFIEKMYIGHCDIIVKRKDVNANFETIFEDEILAKDVPCKLSYNSVSSSEKSANATSISSNVVLFINPDIKIQAGSKIRVTQNKRVTLYSYSGEVAMFSTHQQLALELENEYA